MSTRPFDNLIVPKLLLAALAASGIQACGSARSATETDKQAATPVALATVKVSRIDESSAYIGTLKSRQSVVLRPQIEGRISRIFVRSGSSVVAGTPLIEVDPDRQRAATESSRSAARSAEAELDNAGALIGSYLARREAGRANFKFIRQQRDRYARLRAEGAISQENLDEYDNRLAAARAELEAAEAQLAAQRSAVERARRALDQARAAAREQQVQLQYYRVSAPFDGRIGDIPVRVGDYITPTTELTTITQNRPLEIYVPVPIERASGLYLGMQLQLFDDQDRSLGASKVGYIAPRVDDQTQSVLVKAWVDNAAGRMRSDQFVRARLVWKSRQAVSVPTTAVTQISGQNFVFVAQANGRSGLVARQKVVTLAEAEGRRYPVLAGLRPGEKIVVSGIQKLSDGAPISAL
ncbi:efflux RND transporter periplasmic adaptor subunit [Gloeobacter morelensis]|uniref:Efflux RND transporter periplasmic adaptor subunit n=1 Tax=Gloeobacter morelensis MG652769 TaxID=2781736 RepID=A0ABY3PH87_9CYAN|nr:efflux RND transporter periplasmic adaptor subunit [Gloeobacter morelensis]UFP92949.1 efflux RND transporter periplasmic adaptor subunit [Gloeobacter morelensis MG652769]